MEPYIYKTMSSLACELPDEVMKYKMHGDFDAAMEAIDRWLKRPVGKMMKERLQLEKEYLTILPLEYPYTEEELISLMQKEVEDFSADDLKRLDQAGLADWIFLNGQKHYVHNVIRNVLMKDEEMIRRAKKEKEDKTLLKETISEMKKTGEASWRFRMRSVIRLKDEHFYPGIQLKVHLPIPAELFQVSDVEILDHSSGKVTVDAPDSLYRAICIEDCLQENREFFVEYAFTVRAVYHDFSEEDRKRCEETFDGKTVSEEYCMEQYPDIRFTPYLKSLAKEIVGDETEPLAIARKLYDHVTQNVKYSLMRDYFLIPNISGYCGENLRGDCGVQALLLITLLRICGIPAKWQSGIYTQPDSTGSHDWAMFWVAPYGWLFADPSFGGSAYADGDEERRSFYFGNLDPFRMPANNAYAQSFACEKKFLPIDPCDNQNGEMETEERGYRKREVEGDKILLEAKAL